MSAPANRNNEALDARVTLLWKEMLSAAAALIARHERERDSIVDALRNEIESAKAGHKFYREIGYPCEMIVAMEYGRGKAVAAISKALGLDGELELMKPLTPEECAEMHSKARPNPAHTALRGEESPRG